MTPTEANALTARLREGITPGPWRVEEGTTLIWGACYQHDDVVGMGYPITDVRISPCANWAKGPDLDTGIANARLIAAAPDLLDTIDALAAENARLAARVAELEGDRTFDHADWFWRVMDPDDNGDSPEEAVNRGLMGRFCVCEIASSFTGPVRFGFIAPVLDPESDEEEFVHFATHQEAMEAAKARAVLGGTK